MVKFVLLSACIALLSTSTQAKLKKNRLASGLSVVSGENEEIERFRNKLDKKLSDIERKHPEPLESLDGAANKISEKYSSLKLMIQKQMVKDVLGGIHPLTIDGRPWNSSLGVPPLRGSYASIALNSDLEQLGLKKAGDNGGAEILPHSHYCKYRTPTEVDGDRYSCCIGENTECYTTAGCFCDESCYTKYGDCCTDHFLTCYEHLKLCLIKVDTTGASSEDAAASGKVGSKRKSDYMNSQLMEEDAGMIQGRSALLDGDSPSPAHVEPNACCLQVPFHTNEQNEQGQTRTCCKGVLTYSVCHEEEQEE